MKKRTYYDSTQTVTLHDPFTLESLLIIKYLKSQVAKILLPVI